MLNLNYRKLQGYKLPKRNPYPSIDKVTIPVKHTQTYSQQSLIGNQGDGVDRSDPELYPDIVELSCNVANSAPSPGPGTDAARDHIRRIRENKQLT